MPWKNGNPPLYTVWRSMIGRCYDKNVKQYKDYGGRGIKVCPQWRHSYRQFYADMAPRPDGYTLDRTNVDGDYSPDNCRWATRKQQQRNRRSGNLWVKIEGKKYMVAELRERSGQKHETIIDRAAAGLPLKQVISKKRRWNLEGLALGGVVSGKKRRARTHCKNGHEFTPENTRVERDGKYWRRVCRKCHALGEYKRTHK